MTSACQRYKFFLQITNASSFLLNWFVTFANSIRAPYKHAASTRMKKERYILSVFFLGRTCCHVGIIDHNWLCCWHFTSLDQNIIESITGNVTEYRFVNVYKRELKLQGFTSWVHISDPSFTCQVTWGKLLHLTVSQFPLLWNQEMI